MDVVFDSEGSFLSLGVADGSNEENVFFGHFFVVGGMNANGNGMSGEGGEKKKKSEKGEGREREGIGGEEVKSGVGKKKNVG